MGFVVHWWAIPGTVAFVATWALAAAVFLARPDRRQNRFLALLLAVEGTSVGWGTGLMYFQDGARELNAGQTISDTFAMMVAPVYLLFLSTLDAPVTRPLRSRGVRALLAVPLAAAPVWVVFGPERYAWARGLDAGLVVWALAGLFGLAATVSLVRHTRPGTAARAQARGYLVAFLVRDSTWVLVVTGYLFRIRGFGILVPASALLVFAGLLSYAILKHQLFDIDLRIKWTVSRGTLAAIFLAVFFVVATVASEFLTGQYGYAVGGAVAGLLLFFLAPLQRVAERVGDAALPRVRDTDEYRTVRKREVYRAAVESAMQDGVITEKERDVLATLADELGITSTQARTIERAVSVVAR